MASFIGDGKTSTELPTTQPIITFGGSGALGALVVSGGNLLDLSGLKNYTSVTMSGGFDI